jgi:hypothetical protein
MFAAQTLAQYPGSKIAWENLEVFADAWESQINDLSILVKEVNDVCQGRGEKIVYLSLPRPGVRICLVFVFYEGVVLSVSLACDRLTSERC